MPKYATIGDYWDEEMGSKGTELLHEYQDLFPTNFLEMKGVLGDIGMIKIPFQADAKPVKQHPYRLNPKYTEKVRMDLDKMLATGIIEPVEESEWVSSMVVQEKKTKGEIRICLDLRKLNDACLHDPFPIPFTDEVLDNVEGKKCILSLMDFQVTIILELLQRIDIKQPSLHKWDLFSIQLCLLD